MSVLDKFKLHYEGTTFKKPLKIKEKHMKTTYNKSRGEHFKDIVIAVLVTLVATYVGTTTLQPTPAPTVITEVSPVKK